MSNSRIQHERFTRVLTDPDTGIQSTIRVHKRIDPNNPHNSWVRIDVYNGHTQKWAPPKRLTPRQAQPILDRLKPDQDPE